MGSFKGDVHARRIDRAYRYIGKPWFPVNQEVVKRVANGFTNGEFNDSIDPLLEDLKTDFALFAFVIKELCQRAPSAGNALELLNNPLDLIRSAGIDVLRDIINPQTVPSTHSLHWSEPFQLERLRDTALIASTAAILSDKRELDPELGFTRGIMRQVGLMLIAWNYPSVYQRAFADVGSSQSLDDRLAAELGFTPALLSSVVFSPREGDKATKVSDAVELWAPYDELCEVGEIVARSQNPLLYPKVFADWERVQGILSEALGEKAIDQIRKQALSRSARYSKSFPEVFETIGTFNPEVDMRRHRRTRRATTHVYFNSCSEATRAALLSFYADLPDSQVDKALVGRLLKEVVPSAGFTGGCVFVVDEGSTTLRPKTLIGRVKLRSITNSVLDSDDPAVSAFSSVSPVVQSSFGSSNNDQMAGIYGSIGDSRKVGVLYLEAPLEPQTTASEDTIGAFLVLKRALADALLLD